MGAITATIWTCINGGEEIVADKTLYGCTFEFFEHHLNRFGVKVRFIDVTNEEELRAALNDKTRIVYLETPVNPNLKIMDIRKTAKIAHEFNPEIKVICDNTFATPYLQKPLSLGADIVVHSATKYINGHGDVLAGFIIADQEMINTIRLVGIKDMTGASLAVSLGAPETLIEHPASMTHSPYTEEELEAANIPPGLIRLSIGLEDAEDLIEDLRQAMDLV